MSTLHTVLSITLAHDRARLEASARGQLRQRLRGRAIRTWRNSHRLFAARLPTAKVRCAARRHAVSAPQARKILSLCPLRRWARIFVVAAAALSAAAAAAAQAASASAAAALAAACVSGQSAVDGAASRCTGRHSRPTATPSRWGWGTTRRLRHRRPLRGCLCAPCATSVIVS